MSDALRKEAAPSTLRAFNGLSSMENERLALLAEECAEVIQVIGKIQRHGFESRNPDSLTGLTNRQLLEEELGHVDAAAGLLQFTNDISAAKVMTASRKKLARVRRWLHYGVNVEAASRMIEEVDE